MLRIYLLIAFFQFFVFISHSQPNVQRNCTLFIEAIGKQDTIEIISTVSHHERLEAVEKLRIYYDENSQLMTAIEKKIMMDNSILCDTIIRLNRHSVEKIKMFEMGIRNQNLESNQIDFAGRIYKYMLTFNQVSITYLTEDCYFSLLLELKD